jgi:MFS family permease
VRPIGAILIGAYTDRAGRKVGLALLILLMVIGTTMTAVMPGYATIGASHRGKISLPVPGIENGMSSGRQ